MTTPSVDRPVSEPMMDIDPSRLDEIRDEFSGYDPGIKLGRVFGTPTIREFRALLSMAARALPLPRRYTGGPLEDGLYLWRKPSWRAGVWNSVEVRGGQFVPSMLSWGPSEMAANGNPFWLIGPIPIPPIPESEEASNG